MNKKELKKELDKLNITCTEYSLDGSMAVWDKIVLVQDYTRWKVFYLDERGGQEGLRIFENEAEACIYVYNELKNKI